MGIELSKAGHVAKVCLNVPETKNALSPKMLMDLCSIWDECQKDQLIRSVVVYSALPDIFCAGMDIKESIPLLTGKKPISNAMEDYLFYENNGFKGFSKALLKEKELDKPVIAAINGWCITGGFEMAMACEFRIATEDAKFQMREAQLGIMPMSRGNVFLRAIVGNTRAMEILLTGDPYSAKQLLEWGFLNKVVSNKEKLMEEAMTFAEKLASNGPKSIRGMVRMNRESRGMTLQEALKHEIEIALPVFRSEDPVEGISAQKERRKANFNS
jgi:enoyl-CoA hydratase